MAEPLITICTAPKPFTDPHIRNIQRNAFRSWKKLGSIVFVVVLGKDEGVGETSREFGFEHEPDVDVNSNGTPLISSMLSITRKKSSSSLLSIVNSDILLFEDFIKSAALVSEKFEKFLIIGQRWDMDIEEELDDDLLAWDQLYKSIPAAGTLHPPMGSDYFIFPTSCFQNIPGFAIGRAGWDNWFIYKSRLMGWRVVDASQDIQIIHQNHDYRHLPNGKPHYRLPETKENIARGGGIHTIYSIFDSQFALCEGNIKRKKFDIKKLIREIEIFPVSVFHSPMLGKFFYYLFHPRKAYGIIREKFS